jgi:hypothetical protein
MSDQHELMADLEAEVEHLREAAERCRKIDLGTKLAIALGVACLFSALVWFKPLALVLGIALVLGGLALLGSNRSTLHEITAKIADAEKRRVIDGLAFQNVVRADQEHRAHRPTLQCGG